MVEESSDTATQEQIAMYVRYIDVEGGCVATQFLQLEQIRGHPDAPNICSAIISVVERECYQLPWRKLEGFTTDGANVLISPRNAVIALSRQKVNYFASIVLLIVLSLLPRQDSITFQIALSKLFLGH